MAWDGESTDGYAEPPSARQHQRFAPRADALLVGWSRGRTRVPSPELSDIPFRNRKLNVPRRQQQPGHCASLHPQKTGAVVLILFLKKTQTPQESKAAKTCSASLRPDPNTPSLASASSSRQLDSKAAEKTRNQARAVPRPAGFPLPRARRGSAPGSGSGSAPRAPHSPHALHAASSTVKDPLLPINKPILIQENAVR